MADGVHEDEAHGHGPATVVTPQNVLFVLEVMRCRCRAPLRRDRHDV
jgi:hypothetical protein